MTRRPGWLPAAFLSLGGGGKADLVARALEGGGLGVSASLCLHCEGCIYTPAPDFSPLERGTRSGVTLPSSPEDQATLTRRQSAASPPLGQDYLNVYPSFLLDLSCSVLVPRPRLFCVS